MKNLIALLFTVLFMTVHYGQNLPDIYRTIRFEKSDFTEIDHLIKEAQPNKAIGQLLIIQIQAISRNNLADLNEVYNRLKIAISSSGKEDKDIQKLFLEQHKLFLSTQGAARSLSAKTLLMWMEDYAFRRSFSFDDESLHWPIVYRNSDRYIRLENGDIRPLIELYEKEIFSNIADLMRISSETIYPKEIARLKPTLFDVFAHDYVLQNGHFLYDNPCIWEPTDEFAKMDLAQINRFQALLEQLNQKHNRWDAYAFCVSERINRCNIFEREEAFFKVLNSFQKYLAHHPASNRFALQKAELLAQLASQSSWQKPTKYHNGYVLALAQIEEALRQQPMSEFTERLNLLKEQILKSSLHFHLDPITYPSSNRLMRVDYRNVSSAYFAVFKVEELNEVPLEEKNPLKKYKLKLIKDRTLEFEKDELMQAHNKDYILSDLSETGLYLLVTTPSKAKWTEALNLSEWNATMAINYEVIHLTNMVLRTQSTNKGFALLVNDAVSGKPIAHAKVKVSSRNKHEVNGFSVEGRTDANGHFLMEGRKNFNYTVTDGKDSLSNYGYYYSYNSSSPVTHLVYTDRGIYRPGQSVYFKSLSFLQQKGDANFWQNQKVKIAFKDLNGVVLYAEELNCNDFGSTAGSFVLPKSGFPLGTVRIYVNDVFKKNIQVEEYKRPTYEVVFDKPKGRVVLGEAFEMEGKVMAFAGYPLVNTEVEINVNELRYFPFWCVVEYEMLNYDTTFFVKTDENGIFRFTFISNKPKDAYAVNYRMEAIATDLSGEVQTGNYDLYLGKTSYNLLVDVKEKYRTDELAQVKFEVFNSQNEKQNEVKVAYTLERKQEKTLYTDTREEAEFKDFSQRKFVKTFPHTRYYAHQEEKREVVRGGVAVSNTSFSLNDLKAGSYILHGKTVDEVGDTINSEREFIVWNPKSKRRQHLSEFWVESSTENPQINEEVEFFIGSSYRKAHLLIAQHHENGLLALEYTKLRRRKKMALRLDAAYKNGMDVYLSIVHQGKVLSEIKHLTAIDSSKILKLKLKSIQEPLLPGSMQNWEIEITQNEKTILDAELLVGMYDASLNAFAGNYWPTKLLSPPRIQSDWSPVYFRSRTANGMNWNFPYFNAFPMMGIAESRAYGWNEEPQMMMDAVSLSNGDEKGAYKKELDLENANAPLELEQESPVKSIRENFNETAFFEPQLYVNAQGKYTWRFQLPDALTRWRLMAFAHTKDFKTVYQEQDFQARKELMLETFEPRFWKKGDSLFWQGKVVNLTDKEQEVVVSLKILQMLDDQDISEHFGFLDQQRLLLKSNEAQFVSWAIVVPESAPNLIRFEAEATTDEFSDALRKTIPVLEGKERILLAQNFTISDKGKHKLELVDLKNVSKEAELLDYKIIVQPQPTWSTLLSLTKVMQTNNELNETYFSRYFSAALARYILKDQPEMKQALKSWQEGSESALLSLLEQNNELKSLLLNETPWLLEAESETQQLRRLGQLLDDNQLNKFMDDNWSKLKEMQLPDGTWSWIGKEQASWHITQYVAKGLAHLFSNGIEVDSSVLARTLKALEKEYTRRYKQLSTKDKEKNLGLGSAEVEWLFIRAILEVPETETSLYYGGLLSKKWQNFSMSSQSLIGQIALLKGDSNLAKRLMASFQDKAQNKKELGKYWNQNRK